jgi:dipeptidyl aminopeptidase/acylaminoacyl peptidase
MEVSGTRQHQPTDNEREGYMMNWIAGQPLAKKFKTLVNQDGIFSFTSMLASDIAADLKDSLNGTLWDDQNQWDKHDPSRYTSNWTQPMLVIHSDLDYRCKYYPVISLLISYTKPTRSD